ncbi:hypothetical protein EXIGLDRAFT_761144 [Exidia glandulosa HHB12029]|uniref:3-beta hydroxysteroid dehydrogenase/isomerase domain-containing protein n=1 Tax=Exidia glandulosa HHB12029 TaxID=1314781 RepID=A0A165NRY5_EXIGL|nr:hypothetical protein EXIGLDRAFT_761144 [Exidia glandulosa HHB12029]
MSSKRQSYLVIGGCGFLGWNIATTLLARGEPAVAVFDLVQRTHDERVQFFSGDICDQAAVENAIKKSGATVVFHTASPLGASGVPKALLWKVNVDGTKAVVAACLACKVPALVYTSSASVIFDGNDVIDADERTPYAEKPADEYSATKIEGEKAVLNANGHGKLKTCAIRPAGIFGPGDRLQIPGIIKVLKEGKYGFQLGDNTNLWDATYVDNCVKAHLLAAEKLLLANPPEVDIETRLPSVKLTMGARPIPTSTPSQSTAPVLRSKYDQFSPVALEASDKSTDPSEPDPLAVAGQAFFITNGEPVTFWSYTRAVWAAYADGYNPNKRVVVLPKSIALMIGSVMDVIAWATGAQLTLSTFRVTLTTAHRWHNIEKARRVLGYEPDVGLEEGIRRSVAWFKENEQQKS